MIIQPALQSVTLSSQSSCQGKSESLLRCHEWRGLKEKDAHSRIAERKYLKLLYKLHEQNNTLNADWSALCAGCDMKKRCKKDRVEQKLTVYCLEGCFQRK